MTINKRDRRLGIGFCDKSYSQTDMPGWHDISFGYLSDDGLLYINKPEHGQELADDLEGNGKYGSGDTVGVGLDLETGEGFITYNGKKRDVGESKNHDLTATIHSHAKIPQEMPSRMISSMAGKCILVLDLT